MTMVPRFVYLFYSSLTVIEGATIKIGFNCWSTFDINRKNVIKSTSFEILFCTKKIIVHDTKKSQPAFFSSFIFNLEERVENDIFAPQELILMSI